MVPAATRALDLLEADCIPSTSQDDNGQALSTPELFRNMQALGLEDLRLACKVLLFVDASPAGTAPLPPCSWDDVRRRIRNGACQLWVQRGYREDAAVRRDTSSP